MHPTLRALIIKALIDRQLVGGMAMPYSSSFHDQSSRWKATYGRHDCTLLLKLLLSKTLAEGRLQEV